MSWVRMDDVAYLNAKVLEVPEATRWLWFTSISYSNHQGTRGYISRGVAKMLAGGKRNWERQAKLLVAAGLWDVPEHLSNSGYMVHDWIEYQAPAAESYERRSELSRIRSEAGKKGGERTAALRWGKQNGKQNVSIASANPKQAVSPDPVNAFHYVQSIAAVVPPPAPLLVSEPPKPNQPVRARGGVAKASKRPPAPEGYTELFAHFWTAFEAKKHRKPAYAQKERAIEGNAVKTMLATGLPLNELKAAIDNAFDEEFFSSRNPRLSYLAANLDAYLPEGNAPEPAHSRTQLSTFDREMQLRAEEDAKWDARSVAEAVQ